MGYYNMQPSDRLRGNHGNRKNTNAPKKQQLSLYPTMQDNERGGTQAPQEWGREMKAAKKVLVVPVFLCWG